VPRRHQNPRHIPFQSAQDCSPKKRYGSEFLAKRAAEESMSLDYNLELYVYKCDLCGGWHLTRTKPANT